VNFADKSYRKRRGKIERRTGRMSLVLRARYTICRQRMIAVRLQFARNSDRRPELDQHTVYTLRGKTSCTWLCTALRRIMAQT